MCDLGKKVTFPSLQLQLKVLCFDKEIFSKNQAISESELTKHFTRIPDIIFGNNVAIYYRFDCPQVNRYMKSN